MFVSRSGHNSTTESVKLELEDLKQQLHYTKQQHHVSQALEEDYQQEIQRLEKLVANETTAHSAKIRSLQEENSGLREELLFLNDESAIKNKELDDLSAQLKAIRGLQQEVGVDPNNELEKATLQQQIAQMKEQLFEAVEKTECVKTGLENSEKQNGDLTRTIQVYNCICNYVVCFAKHKWLDSRERNRKL